MDREPNPLLLNNALDEEVRISSRRRVVALIGGALGGAALIGAAGYAYHTLSRQPAHCTTEGDITVCQLPPIETK